MSTLSAAGQNAISDQGSSWYRRLRNGRTLLPGVVAAVAVAAPAIALGSVAPLVGAPVLALAIGAALAAVRRPPPAARAGLAWSSRTVLQAAVVALGGTLSLARVGSVGLDTLPVMLTTLTAALGVAALGGRAMGVPGRLRTLVGAGTGICGASAIAAVTGVIAATEVEVAYAMTTIFAFNIAAVLLFPLLGHALGMSQGGFGLWAGTAVNDTSSVVAVGYAFGTPAGVDAVVVKLTRTTMIVPVVAALALRARRRGGRAPGVSWRRVTPWFLVWFALAATARTAGLLPGRVLDALGPLAAALITVALAAIGLSIRLGDLRGAGHRPLVLGAMTWLAVAVTGLAAQRLLGRW